MAWIKLSDDFYDSDKVEDAGPLGAMLWIACIGYCNRNLTDGVIPRAKALRLLEFSEFPEGTDKLTLDRAISSGLLHESGHDCPSCDDPRPPHLIVHDYLEFQASRAEVMAKRDAAAGRMRRVRENRKSSSQDVRANIEGSSPNPNPTPKPKPKDSGYVQNPPYESNARASDFTEMVHGRRERPPQPPPEAPRGEVATTAGDLVSKTLPRNKYGAAVMTGLRIEVGEALADGVPKPVVEEMLRAWDENARAGVKAFRYQQAVAEKRLAQDSAPKTGAVTKAILGYAEIAQKYSTEEDHGRGNPAIRAGDSASPGSVQGV